MVEVCLFGGLSVTVDGRPVELPADARARELLARLALAPGLHARSTLAGRLRPDVPEDSARKSLRSALYELRRVLADAVVTDGDRIGLADGVRVDARLFQSRAEAGDLDAAVAVAGPADAPGELLAGMDGDWALRAREAHAAELARMHGELAVRAEREGDLAAAVSWARRRVALDPLAEAAHRELIRLLALGGDRAAAIAGARGMAERLRSELGVAPSPATRALIDDVRRGAVGPPSRGAVTGPPPLPAHLAAATPLEGRSAESERLEAVWRAALAGVLRCAVIAGEAGIGKTALAAALARRARAGGATVLLGRCDEHAIVGFQPWIEALERVLDHLPAGEADRWLTSHDGALAQLLPARALAGAGPAAPRERFLAFELVRELLGELAARAPVLFVLDDLHWADADSLLLLRHVARGLPHARLLVVLCARGDELTADALETLAALRREAPVVRVDLAGLDDAAVGAVVARRLGTADPEAARRLGERSGGNPFFLDELLREAEESGGAAGPPAGVREVVGRRLLRLGEPTVGALEAAAVCGPEFDVEVLAAVAGRPEVEVLEALDPALAAGLLRPSDRPARLAFAHALVIEAITASLPASRLARLHLGVAGVLAGADGGATPREHAAAAAASAGEVVRHLRAAGPLVAPERLGTWELAAAREATAALAHADAAAHYEAALTIADGGARTPLARAELLLALGAAADRAGRRGHAREAFAAAAREAADPAVVARAALGHGGVGVVIAAADPATVALLEAGLAALAPDDHATAARLSARLAIELYYADRARARRLSAEAVERARRAGDPAALAAALNARRVALWTPADAHERLATATAMVEAAQAAGDHEALLQARNWRVVDLLELGRTHEVEAEVDAYAAVADAVVLPHFRWYVPLWRGTLAILAGRWDDARAFNRRALELGRRADDANAELFVGIQRHHVLLAQRQVHNADRGRLVEEAHRSQAPVEWLVNLALIEAEDGRHEEARRLLAELTPRGIAMDVNWHAACILGEAAVAVGDRAAAATAYDLLEPHARLFPLIGRAAACLGSAEHYVGRLAGVLGRTDEAVARLRRALEAEDRAGTLVPAAVSALRLGQALRAAGDPSAADVLEDAASRADALGLPRIAAMARGTG